MLADILKLLYYCISIINSWFLWVGDTVNDSLDAL
jgi:hypothetical protein